jgi:hypothetical protein
LDIFQGWIRDGRLRAYPVNASFDYDDNDGSDEAAKHWWKCRLDVYLTQSNFAPDKIGNIDFETISVRENELNELLEGKPSDDEFSGPAWEADTTKWIPLELAVQRVAEASGLPWPAARSSLFHAVNSRSTYALCAIRPGLAPSVWFMGAPGRPRLIAPAPPETVVDPLSLEAWIASELVPEPAVVDSEAAADLEGRCRAWLVDEMRKSPEPTDKRKVDWLSEAKRLFPGLSGNAFRDRVWPAAIRATDSKWGKAGRPKSSR